MKTLLALLTVGVALLAATPAMADDYLNVDTCKSAVSGGGTNDNDRAYVVRAAEWGGAVMTGQTATYLGYTRYSSSFVDVRYRHHAYTGDFTVTYDCRGYKIGQAGVISSCEDYASVFPTFLLAYMQANPDNIC